MKRPLFYFLLVTLILVVSCFYLVQKIDIESPDSFIQNKNTDSGKEINTETETETETEKETETSEKSRKQATVKTSTATLSAIGDILIHDRVYNPAHVGNGQYDF